MTILDDVPDRRTLILGLAREGLSTLGYLRDRFPEKRFAVADRREPDQLDPATRKYLEIYQPLDLSLGGDYQEALADAELVFKSPGISPYTGELAGPLRGFVERGGRLTSNTELFFEEARGRIIGVTGTKGKSTTTAVIHHVLNRGGVEARLTGNIGTAPLDAVSRSDEDTVFVAEFSSHQLLGLAQSPDVAVIQNIVPEHLDYYGDFETYVEAKASICQHQKETDYVLFNAAYPLPGKLAARSRGIGAPFGLNDSPDLRCLIKNDQIVFRDCHEDNPVMSVFQVPLPGRFNLQNVMPAILIGRMLFDLPQEVVAEAVESFQALEHRLEPSGVRDGVSFYNDSLATVPEATLAAIDALSDRPIVLIVGGFDRGQDFSDLARGVLHGSVKGLVLFPPAGRRLWEEVSRLDGATNRPGHVFVERMGEAVDVAFGMATRGDYVLLSPAAASFGTFRDYSDRGRQFKAEVGRLASSR